MQKYQPFDTEIYRVLLAYADKSHNRSLLTRTSHALYYQEIHTPEAAMSMTDAQLLKTPNFGRLCLSFLRKALIDQGYATPEQELELKAQKQRGLRDSFAMAALQGLLACPVGPDSDFYAGKSVHQYVSENAYNYADAMLKARQSCQTS